MGMARSYNPNPVKVWAKAPRFFKIIVDPRSPRLRIPGEIMLRHGQNIHNPVFLRVPTGIQMEVELIEHEGDTWLNKGWPEFKDCYSINFGHFLVFEYAGNSVFNVLIFDMSASEIEYPVLDERTDNDVRTAVPKQEDEAGSDSDDSVVFLDEFPKSDRGRKSIKDDEDVEISDDPKTTVMKKRKRAKADDDTTDDHRTRKSVGEIANISPCSNSKGGLRSKSLSFFNNNHSTRVAIFDLGDQTSLKPKSKKECWESNERQCSNKGQVKGEVAIDRDESVAYERATSFVSDNPSRNPYYISLLQPSYASKNFILNVPLPFASANLPSRSNNLMLRVSDGKTWPVKCVLGIRNAKLTVGWKAFVQDNGLKVGDVCIFHVVNGSKILWNVLIFRN